MIGNYARQVPTYLHLNTEFGVCYQSQRLLPISFHKKIRKDLDERSERRMGIEREREREECVCVCERKKSFSECERERGEKKLKVEEI